MKAFILSLTVSEGRNQLDRSTCNHFLKVSKVETPKPYRQFISVLYYLHPQQVSNNTQQKSSLLQSEPFMSCPILPHYDEQFPSILLLPFMYFKKLCSLTVFFSLGQKTPIHPGFISRKNSNHFAPISFKLPQFSWCSILVQYILYHWPVERGYISDHIKFTWSLILCNKI